MDKYTACCSTQVSIRGDEYPRCCITLSSTLHDHVSGKSSRIHSGAPTVLSADEEKEIVTSCEVMQELGFPMTKEFVSVALRDYLRDKPGRGDRFKNGIPGSDWWVGFFRRHPKLVERKPEHLPNCRAEAANPEVSKKNMVFNKLLLHRIKQ